MSGPVTTRARTCPAVLLGVLLALVVVAPPAPAQPASDGSSALRIPIPSDDGSLTPYTFEVAYPLVTLVYDTLLWRDAEGVPRPWLAQEVSASADGLTLTIPLAPDARWHDGRPVTADDVAFTFRYVSARWHPRFTPQLEAVERVEVVDDETVRIHLAHPAPGFADQPLADLPILPAHLWEGLGPGEAAPAGAPVGSGPYRLVDHRPGQGYRFEADPSYFRGAPEVAVLEVPVVGELGDMLRRLREGRLDAIPVSLPEDVARSVRSVSVQVRTGPSYLGTVLVLNTRRPPFDDPDVRRAVAAALDLRRIAATVGGAVPATHGYLHPASPWAPTEPLHRTDPTLLATMAERLPRVTVLTPENDPVKQEAARQVVLALRRAGVDATVGARDRDELAEALGESGREPSFDAAIGVAPVLASYDPDFLARIFGSDPERAPLNRAGYRSERFDELAEEVATAAEQEEREQAVEEALRLVATDAPVVPLFFDAGRYAHRPGAYDRWLLVKGSGILDKRSFLPGPRPSRSSADADPVIDESSAGPPLLGVAAVVAAGAAVVLALVALVGRRRRP